MSGTMIPSVRVLLVFRLRATWFGMVVELADGGLHFAAQRFADRHRPGDDMRDRADGDSRQVRHFLDAVHLHFLQPDILRFDLHGRSQVALNSDQPLHLASGLIVVDQLLITWPLINWMMVLPRAMM